MHTDLMDTVEKPFDVIVVGAGPAGSTAAYYLAKGTGSASGRRVALLEKATFPRDKYCGDAWCAPALDILEDMGVLQKLAAEGLVRNTVSGGFVSPSGESYVATGEGGTAPGTRCYAIKRIVCDERIARRAAEAGAQLVENAAVASVKLDDDGLWTVACEDGRRFRATMLVAADGATSRIARSLGVVTTAPDAVASRQYVKGGTHNFKSDGILLYPTFIAPGYVALYRHHDDDIDLGTYLVPGGPVTAERFAEVYETQVLNDPYIRQALGPRAEFRERVHVGVLRTGGVPRSTARQFMAVGDAAGQTDPLTGEGIHTGMIGGKLAAETIHELFAKNDFSESACAAYHTRWMAAFGTDFATSAQGARIVEKLPLVLDAANVVAQRKGQSFMAEFGAAMTGVKPKSTFMQRGVAIPMGMEVVRQFVLQKILHTQPASAEAYRARALEDTTRPTAFQNSALVDRAVGRTALEGAPPKPTPSALAEIFRHAGNDPAARRVLVLYGSEYGFAKELARTLCEKLATVQVGGDGPPLSPRCVNMAHHQIVDWSVATTCLAICSTAGDGVPPAAARSFFQSLEHPSADLSKVRYAVLALGDLTYPQFCRAGRTLDERFRERRATALLPRVDVDREDPRVVREWLDRAGATLADPATWRGCAAEPAEDTLRARARDHFASQAGKVEKPTEEHPFMARLVAKKQLTKIVESYDEEVLYLEFDVTDENQGGLPAVTWEPGDALGVVPLNAPDEVDAVLAGLQRDGNEAVDLPKGKGRTTLREALFRHLDIKKVSPDVVEAIFDAATAPEEKERAATLRQGGTATYRTERELQDILRDFPSAGPALPTAKLLGLLGEIQPRFYSISSSQEVNPTRLSLTVAIVRYELLGRPRRGLTTCYLSERVSVGDRVAIFTESHPMFRLPPPESGRSCVMVGAGCGIAPYRGFMEELERRANQGAPRTEPNLLFFGCRHAARDYLYPEELKQWETKNLLRVVTAFSRDQAQKVYVQDRMREHGAHLWKMMEAGDYFYICGDASRMAGDVEKAMRDIIIQQGGKSPEEADMYLMMMANEGRFEKDVW